MRVYNTYVCLLAALLLLLNNPAYVYTSTHAFTYKSSYARIQHTYVCLLAAQLFLLNATLLLFLGKALKLGLLFRHKPRLEARALHGQPVEHHFRRF